MVIVSRGTYAARVWEKTRATGSTETQHSVDNASLFRLLISLLGCYELCTSSAMIKEVEAAIWDHSSPSARQKLGRIAVRHFSDWLPHCNACRSDPTVSKSLRNHGMRTRHRVTARQIESISSWVSSYLSQYKADLKRSLASQRADRGIMIGA
jgi:hypothetical protein